MTNPNFVILYVDSPRRARASTKAAQGGFELAFAVHDRAKVTELYQAWTGRGLRVAQQPVDLDFGHTFVALDPDKHRLSVFAAA